MQVAFLRDAFPFLLEGLRITILLAILGFAGAATGGLVVAFGRRSRNDLVRWVATCFVEVMRNTPILVQIFVLYFGAPSLGLYPDAFSCALIALTVQNSAYVGEIYRAGIESVHHSQMEAALTLGMLPKAAMRWIVLPQAFRRVLPALGNQAVIVLQETSIASTISVADLTQSGRLLLDRSAAPYETFFAIGVLYLLMTFLFLGGLRLLAIRLPVRV